MHAKEIVTSLGDSIAVQYYLLSLHLVLHSHSPAHDPQYSPANVAVLQVASCTLIDLYLPVKNYQKRACEVKSLHVGRVGDATLLV
jgi:hypothetical protein